VLCWDWCDTPPPNSATSLGGWHRVAGAAQHHPLCPTHVHTCVLSMCVCPPHRPTGHIRVSRTQTRVPRQAHARARHMCAEVSYTLPRANAHVCTQVGRYPPPPCKHTRAHVCAGIATQCAETPTCLQVSHSHVQTHTHVCMRVTLPCANTHACHAPVCKHTCVSCSCVQTHMHVTLPCANTHACHAPVCKHTCVSRSRVQTHTCATLLCASMCTRVQGIIHPPALTGF